MRRRDLLAVFGAAVVARRAGAQLAATRRRVAFVHSSIPVDQLLESGGSPARWVPQFFEELRRLGDFEGIGGNLQVDRYSGEGHPERYNGLARRVINSRPDLIITVAPLIPAFRALTTTIPIAGFFADPTRLGFVESLARPGGNITGVSIDAGVEIYGKQLQLLKEAVPQAVKVGYLATNRVWNTPIAQAAREASSSLGMSLIGMVVPEVTISQLRRAFAETAGKALDAIVVSPAGEFLGSISTITHIVGRRELPAMYPYREYIEGGGLMAYAPELSEPARQLANQVHQILNRKTPSEIPVFQATKFELLLNLQAARSLGISFSPALLARADEIIE